MNNKNVSETNLVDQLINHIVIIWMVLSTVGVWLLIERSQELVGWQLREFIYFFLYIVIVVIFIFRKKVNSKVIALFFVFFLFVIAFVGVVSFGLMAPAALFIPIISVLLALFYHSRVVTVFSVLMLLLVGLIGHGFQSGYLKTPVPANELIVNTGHWNLYLLSLTFFVLFVSIAILSYKKMMTDLVEQITANKQAMEKLANHDQLTGLANSQMAQLHFENSVEKLGSETSIAIMFLDLDKFKMVNDTYGHEAGDMCLKHVAQKAREALKNDGKIYRLGGDEFLILYENFTDDDEVLSVAEGVIKSISEPFKYQDNMIVVNTSVGVAIYREQKEKFNDLRRSADRAMYQAKQSHDENVCLAAEHSALSNH